MDRFLVHDEPVNGSVTHAIVIGAGAYRHLPEGSGPQTAFDEGMAQLSSPQASALAFADWLIGQYHNSQRPLATVALVLSDENDVTFANPKTNEQHQVERATVDNVKEAVRDWKRRGDENEENLMLFFFSGHGIAQGPDTALLLEDYGATDDDVFEGAVDFAKLHLGMARCQARDQVYFVDACRASTDTLIEALGYAGQVIIAPKASELQSVRAPVFYSTVAGAKAFGRKDKPSYFTESLLRAFRGGGADDISDRWTVSTTRLKEATDQYMELLFSTGKARRVQTPAAEALVTFELLELLDTPITPVICSCSPEDAIATAILRCSSEGGFSASRDEPEDVPWELEVPGGEEYKFQADFPADGFQSALTKRHIRPPLRKVTIRVV